jgi:hypothetical protein
MGEFDSCQLIINGVAFIVTEVAVDVQRWY